MMLLGNAAWGFRNTSLEQQLDITSKMGLSLLELSIAGHPNDALQLDASPVSIANVKKLFDKYNMEIDCTATGNDFTLPNKADNLQQLNNTKKVIDIVGQLEGQYLRIFAGFAPAEDVVGSRRQIMMDCLKATADYAADAGIIPVMETHGGVEVLPNGVRHFHSISSQPETLAGILDEVPELFINFDPANLYAVGIGNPEDFFYQFQAKIRYVHFKDFVPVAASDVITPAACGESDMNWKTLLAAMEDYSGPALIEYENTHDVASGCLRSLQFLNKTLKQLSIQKVTI